MPDRHTLHYLGSYLPSRLLGPAGRHGLLQFLLPGQLVRLLQGLAQ